VSATAVCVAILDEDSWTSRTDVLVVVDAARRRLTWVPRDLWSSRIGLRINHAFAGGHLLPALADLGFPCDGAICLRRGATVAWLADIEVEVPVPKPLDFWYPLEPMSRIQDGRKQVSFRPPRERLSGERLHQWVGARHSVSGPSSDLYRCARQGDLLFELLRQKADFAALLRDSQLYRIQGSDPLAVLAQADETWTMRVFDRVHDQTIEGAKVLRKSSWLRHSLGRLRAFVSRLLKGTD